MRSRSNGTTAGFARGVAERQRAEAGSECHLPVVVQVLIAQEDHLVVEQRLTHLRDRIVAGRVARVDTGDLRADVPGQAADPDSGDGVGHGHAFQVFGRACATEVHGYG
jgi:hypothetical protein